MVMIAIKGRQAAPQEVEQLSAAVARTAEKRVALKFIPERYVSWDHSKLGGRY